MDIFEFELRYKAYRGLNTICKLGWDEEMLIKMIATTSGGKLSKALHETSPEELKQITRETYTSFKKEYIQTHSECTESFTKEQFHYPLSEYLHRLEYELKVIKEMGFNTYMLVVSDFVMRAKKNSIMVGPGRGSGAGSLLAYMIAITDVNPFAYDLLFERFLNPARVSMPDFDIDFEDTLRSKVVEYVTNKYGHDHVASIGTYMKLATKAAFKDAARSLGIPFDQANKISTLMGELKSLNWIIQKKEEVPEELLNLYDSDPKIQNAVIQGAELEGNLRQLGVHACGIIISPDPVSDHTATQTVQKGNETTVVTQFDGPTLEYIGLLKMDFLGLRNLSVIKNCIKILRAKYKDRPVSNNPSQTEQYYRQDQHLFDHFIETMSFKPDINNQDVFKKVFETGDTTGIFQFEGEGIRKFLIELKPNHINDLVAMNALYRPGPLEFIPTYIKRKHGIEAVTYMLDDLKEILLTTYNDPHIIALEQQKLEEDLGPIMNITYGIAIYQEQLMFLVQSMAGFSLPEADLLRRGVGKKKIEIIEQLKKEFMARAQTFRDYKPETAKFIYEKMIEPAASYSFNKSHSVCYAYIAYQTGYLKARYPLEFYAALLRSVEEDTDKMSGFIDEILAHNIKIESPSINKAYNHIAATDDTIIMGFYACKGIGFEIGEQIEDERKNNGQFTSLENFLERCPFVANKRVMESLIKAGCFDERHDRTTLLLNLSTLIERHKNSAQLDMGLFGGLESTQTLTFQHHATTSIVDKCKYDVEVFKNMISGHPLDGLYPYMRKYGYITQLKNMDKPGEFKFAGMVKKITRAKKYGYFILVEDPTDTFEFFLTSGLDIEIYDMLIISGYKRGNPNIYKIIKTSLESFQAQAKNSQSYDEQWTVARIRADLEKARKEKEEKLAQRQQNNPTTDNESDTQSENQSSSHLSKEQSAIDIIETQDNLPGFEIDSEVNTDTEYDTVGDAVLLDKLSPSETEETSIQELDTPTDQPITPQIDHSSPETALLIDIPADIERIRQLVSIIKSHQGNEYFIAIDGTNHGLTLEGYKQIQPFITEQ